jgi:hypothetical protein
MHKMRLGLAARESRDSKVRMRTFECEWPGFESWLVSEQTIAIFCAKMVHFLEHLATTPVVGTQTRGCVIVTMNESVM